MVNPKDAPFAWKPVLAEIRPVVLRRLKSRGGGQLTEKKREEILRVGDAEIDKAMGEQATRLGTEMAARGDTTSSFGRQMAQQHKKNTLRAKEELRLELDAFLVEREQAKPSRTLKKKLTCKRRAKRCRIAPTTPTKAMFNAYESHVAGISYRKIAEQADVSKTTIGVWVGKVAAWEAAQRQVRPKGALPIDRRGQVNV